MRVSLEFKKSILMIFLLLLCVFQMGILWSDKSPGIPFPFSSQNFWPKTETVDIEQVKGFYIQPKRIVVSDGADVINANGKYWPLPAGSNFYQSIWTDFSGSYLKQILEKKPVDQASTDWDTIMKMKCIIIEFKIPIPVGILQWMSGTKKPVMSPFKQIHKIAIFPESINYTNYNENTLYITEDGKTAYKYIVTLEGGMKKEDYISLIDGIGENSSIIPLRLVGTYHPVKNDELLAVLSEEKEEKIIWDLLVKTPEEIILQRDNVDRIQELLLDSGSNYTELNEYTEVNKETGLSEERTEVLFSDDEKIVRYYSNGFLDYRFRQLNGAKGTVEEAFEKAIAFIEFRRKTVIHETDICLSEIDSTLNENYHIFTFDYVLDDMAIKVLDDEGKTVRPAITICANRERVLDVKWYIKTFSYNDYHNYYNLNFYDFYENQLFGEPQFGGQIQDISIDYLYTENGMRAEPYWLVETDQEFYHKMEAEGE